MADSLSLSLFPDDTALAAIVCGADEAGRGPIAGPVYAAAVVLDPENPIAGLADSKKLSERKRDALAPEIRQKAKAWAVALATVEEIDELNILNAAMLAMGRAIALLDVTPSIALIDGNRIPKGLPMPAQAIVKGDATVPEISAASILAKTARDAQMMVLHAEYPQYGFDRHKGYPTAFHLAQLQQYGVSPVHRRSFGPVARLLCNSIQKEQ